MVLPFLPFALLSVYFIYFPLSPFNIFSSSFRRKLRLCSHSPFSSIQDVRGLLSDESIINESAPSTFREYNTEQMLQVQSPGGNHKVLITKQGEVGHGEYLDPRGNKVISFDHLRQV